MTVRSRTASTAASATYSRRDPLRIGPSRRDDRQSVRAAFDSPDSRPVWRSPLPIQSCTSTSGCLCRRITLGRANREIRKSPDGFGLHHGLRGVCAVPEPVAVAGATPRPGRVACHGGGSGCARHPNPPREVAPGQRSLREGGPRLADGGRAWSGGHRQRPPALRAAAAPALSAFCRRAGWTCSPRWVDLADEHERCRVLVGTSGAPPLPTVGASFPVLEG